MSEHDVKAGKVDEAEKVFDVVFPTSDGAAEVMHPGEHFLSFAITAQLASSLDSLFTSAPVGCDQFDAVLALELFIERVRIVGFVAKNSSYKFLDSFIGEMAAVFPDAYFHIGGDACNGKEWNANPQIQSYMRAHGIANNAALQAYFTAPVQTLVAKHHKIMEGWDEVLQPERRRMSSSNHGAD